ncbi:MAG: ROK family transcriptional regulator [Dysgonamonadaceae bacterium]|jgi:glucokinase-like ROK family protein|nr:ROK family transcriptional regulator [Dysgonamonadaceae bacterium]
MTHPLMKEIESGSKNALLKVDIIRYYINFGETTLNDLSKEMNLSIPTITKLIGELIEDGFVMDFGKQETNGGRRPNVYGLKTDSGYFVGVDIKRFQINLGLMNFKGDMLASKHNIPFFYENTAENFDKFCTLVNDFIRDVPVPKSKILSVGVNISGRVNTETGHSYSLYYLDERPLTDILQEKIGLHVTIDNDSRSMAYGEYMKGVEKNIQNMLFINVSWGLGMGMIINGKLYYGKSGFSGEFGHMSVFDNEFLCHCGKKGCLETQASGSYIYRRFFEKIEEGNSSILEGNSSILEGSSSILKKKISRGDTIVQEDILDAALKEDILSIELVEEVGFTLGKYLAGLINIFNPELVVIGGTVARTGDYLLFPIKSAIKKYSLNMINKDTAVRLSKLGEDAGLVGACMLTRNKFLRFE